MTPEELLPLLDAYRDGTLSPADAASLAQAIRAGGEESARILRELEFSGQLAQALDQTNAESFTRSFFERLRAEETAGKFTSRFEEKRKAEMPAPPASPASGSATRSSSDAEETGLHPQIHYGTGIHKFVKGKGEARVGSSQRLRALRRQRPASLERPLWPIFLAAAVMAAVTLWLALGRGGGLAHVSPPATAQEPKVREAIERNRLAQEELARRAEAARVAREKAGRADAERRKIQTQLAELERKRQELMARAGDPGEEKSPVVTEVQKQEAEGARRQELARLEAQRKTEADRLTQAEAQAEQAEAELARTETAQKEAEQKLALARRRAEELGRVIFVVELKKDEAAGPVLVRGKGADTKRIPLTKDLPILAGDRIETGAEEKSAIRNPQSATPRPVFAALELASGATVDLAYSTNFEVTGAAEAKLDEGLLFAEVSGFSAVGAGNLKGTAAGKWVLKTPHANVEVEQASFDLSADASQAVLRVTEGGASFANAAGRQKAEALQKITAPKDGSMVKKELTPAELWAGRKGTFHLGLLSHWTLDEGKGQVAADASGHGNKGTLVGVPAWTPGKLGGALQLDGTKDYVDYGSGAGLNFGAGAAFTFAGWVKTKDSFGPILSQRSSTEEFLKGAMINICVGFEGWAPDAGKLMVTVRENGGMRNGSARVVGGVVNGGQWHHFAFTRDGAGRIELYLDGTSQGAHTGTHSAGAITTNMRSMGSERFWAQFGFGTADQRYLNGALDDVRIYARMLTAEEIAGLANQAGPAEMEKR